MTTTITIQTGNEHAARCIVSDMVDGTKRQAGVIDVKPGSTQTIHIYQGRSIEISETDQIVNAPAPDPVYSADE